MQVANPNRAQFTKCARTAIPYTTMNPYKHSKIILTKENDAYFGLLQYTSISAYRKLVNNIFQNS